MSAIEVRTQAELDKALANLADDEWIECHGSGHFEVRGSSSVVARGSSSVVARGSSRVEASPYVAIQRHGATSKVKGGVLIQIPLITTAAEWCDYYGVKVTRGVATLFKAVGDDYSTSRARQKDVFYTPGSKPSAPDWDGGKNECGGGLHFSPAPAMALEFNSDAARFVACPVRVAEIVVHKDPVYPGKVKAPRVCGPVFEVDRFGERIEAAV